MRLLATRSLIALATLWVGSLWTVGYIVAPTLFATLDSRMLAGSLAGRMFHVQAWVSIACAVLISLLMMRDKLSFTPRQRKHLYVLIACMLLCTLLSHFGIQPYMAALKIAAGTDGVMPAATQASFGRLHGISSMIYLVQSVLGLVLIFKLYKES